jgi:hypothetical protein
VNAELIPPLPGVIADSVRGSSNEKQLEIDTAPALAPVNASGTKTQPSSKGDAQYADLIRRGYSQQQAQEKQKAAAVEQPVVSVPAPNVSADLEERMNKTALQIAKRYC